MAHRKNYTDSELQSMSIEELERLYSNRTSNFKNNEKLLSDYGNNNNGDPVKVTIVNHPTKHNTSIITELYTTSLDRKTLQNLKFGIGKSQIRYDGTTRDPEPVEDEIECDDELWNELHDWVDAMGSDFSDNMAWIESNCWDTDIGAWDWSCFNDKLNQVGAYSAIFLYLSNFYPPSDTISANPFWAIQQCYDDSDCWQGLINTFVTNFFDDFTDYNENITSCQTCGWPPTYTGACWNTICIDINGNVNLSGGNTSVSFKNNIIGIGHNIPSSPWQFNFEYDLGETGYNDNLIDMKISYDFGSNTNPATGPSAPVNPYNQIFACDEQDWCRQATNEVDCQGDTNPDIVGNQNQGWYYDESAPSGNIAFTDCCKWRLNSAGGTCNWDFDCPIDCSGFGDKIHCELFGCDYIMGETINGWMQPGSCKEGCSNGEIRACDGECYREDDPMPEVDDCGVCGGVYGDGTYMGPGEWKPNNPEEGPAGYGCNYIADIGCAHTGLGACYCPDDVYQPLQSCCCDDCARYAGGEIGTPGQDGCDCCCENVLQTFCSDYSSNDCTTREVGNCCKLLGTTCCSGDIDNGGGCNSPMYECDPPPAYCVTCSSPPECNPPDDEIHGQHYNDDNSNSFTYIKQECLSCDEEYNCCGFVSDNPSDLGGGEDCRGICNGPSYRVPGVGPQNECWYTHCVDNPNSDFGGMDCDEEQVAANEDVNVLSNAGPEWGYGCCVTPNEALVHSHESNWYFCPGYPNGQYQPYN